MNGLKQLKAAAGSGKTYALTERFLSLMAGSSEDSPSLACTGTAPAGYCWPEILAATFTNKAAAEMKERVVASIKRTALQIPEGQKADWDPAAAEATLNRMLRRYNQLGIRTIDSLLNLLLRVFALDAGLNPDFEIIFEADEPFNSALDRIIAACAGGDGELATLYMDCLRTILDFETDSQGKAVSGFKLEGRLRAKLQSLTSHLINHPGEVETDPQTISQLLVPSYDAFNQSVASMRQCIEGNNLDALANFTKFLAKCEGIDLFVGPPASVYAAKDSLADCIKKASKPLVSPVAETCYHNFKQCHAKYTQAQAILSRAYSLAPAVELSRRVLELMMEDEKASGKVLGSTLPGRVRTLLSGEYGVPDAFCRLGSRLHHLLIDEFQDTSRDQWAAIAPLAEECLSKGGSLFYVGDVKQAIYGWRGGDATLFDEVGAHGDTGLAHLVDAPISTKLENNWRSKKEIVQFNNDLFTRLASPELVEQLADELLEEAPEDCRQAFADALRSAYADAAQELPKGKDTAGGYVRIEQLAGGLAEDIISQALNRTEALIADELAGRRNLSDICVLVRKKDHATLLCDRLVARGIPVVTESSLQLNLHPAVRQLVALLGVIDFPGDDMALAEFLLGDLFLNRTGLRRDELLEWMATRAPGPLHLAFRDAYPVQWKRCMTPFVRKAGLMTPYDLVSDAVEYFQVRDCYPECELFLRRFQEMVHGAAESGRGSLAGFLEMWREKGDEEKVSLPESVNAVRIMTMHKAKGLQFPVVVVPFLFWPFMADSSLMTVNMNGTQLITQLSRSMGAPWFDKRRIDAQEQLNLLYVAFTRAEEELYAYTPSKAKGKAPAHAALDLLLSLDEDKSAEEHGIPGTTTEVAPLFEMDIANRTMTMDEAEPELMTWLPRLRVHRHMEEATFDARMRGQAAHKCMEFLCPPMEDEEEARRTAAVRARILAMQEFPLLAGLPEYQRAELESDLDAMLLWVMTNGDLCSWLAAGRSEATFLDENGESKRPDFLHFGNDVTIILEFKTGEEREEHIKQTKLYMQLAAQVSPDKTIRGVVVYLDLQKLVEVSGE